MENEIIENKKNESELLPARSEVQKMITVLLDNSTPHQIKHLHCSNCGRIIAQYYGEIRIIIMGETRECQRPVDIMCSRCKIMYRID